MRLFPNAVEVTIDGVYPYSGVNARSRLSAYRDFRNQQNVLDVSPAERLQAWGRLRRVRGGSALEVHWLGFRSRVPHLDITIPKHFYGSITLVLQYAQPRWLTLRMPDPDCMPPSLEVDPPAPSGPQSRSRDLTHLIMRMPRNSCRHCGLKGVFNRLSRLLERSSISHLLLELYSDPSDKSCAVDPVFELMAREVDECHGEYVRLLGQTVPSLFRVFLDAWERVPEPHHWREWSEDVGRTLVVADMNSR
ncbi:hypothetical protein K466DRAFT_33418 [Polyporus arcularius HHB13444]|uniref:Uncharacterized protein n=1 Tax=Polyporus arcularius HHB13444 TaxID=1314778 RepID=A0A5C3NQ48_9APHY|nr:hypothetical protein K466DRAFT_33418 [Polyporus arcularius HHB13444]